MKLSSSNKIVLIIIEQEQILMNLIFVNLKKNSFVQPDQPYFDVFLSMRFISINMLSKCNEILLNNIF